jgi:glycosyltransferase involved in cell wall biosynthesis
MPKVSVIIPAFNAMKFLDDMLQSIAAQTFQDYEVIIVNDGSSDGIKTWFTQISDPKVKLISQANQGAAVARNTGILQSQAEYIALLDADDLWEPTKLAKQVQILDQEPQIGLVYTWVALVDRQGNPTGKIRSDETEGDAWEKLIEHNVLECCSTPLIRRECFEKVGLFDSQISQGSCGSEDWDMWLRIAERYAFRVVPEPLTQYRQHEDNGSKNWTIMEQDYARIVSKTFASAPPDRQHLQSRCAGFAYLRIAWKALQNSGGDCQAARHYRSKALSVYPAIRGSGEYRRFGIALFLVQTLGLNQYSWLRETIYLLKNFLFRRRWGEA